MIRKIISAIICVKNGERYLNRAIDSIINQSYPADEIIIIDGNSIDRTEEIARSYPEVNYYQQQGQGISDAYNQGLLMAKYKFVAFLSHDDVWLPDKLSSQISYLIAYPEIDYVVAKAKFILTEGHKIPRGFKPDLLVGDRVAYIMETLVAKKSVFDRIGKFNPEYTVGEDVDWFARAKDAKILKAVIPKVLLYKYIHDTNLSNNAAINNQNLLKIIRQSIQKQRVQNEIIC
jgi:glycosyltransferase involved in cell wall biosynthesis